MDGARVGMTDRPIIFSGPMVRALLAGRKTQTRRLLNPQPESFSIDDSGRECLAGLYHDEGTDYQRVTLGSESAGVITLQRVRFLKGDRLYVRENCRGEELADGQDGVRFAADDAFIPIENSQEAADRWLALHRYRTTSDEEPQLAGKPVPCIHMPRWASRLTLTVTDVRIQRLQSMSEADAEAEGVVWDSADGHDVSYIPGAKLPHTATAAACFACLWNSLHGPGSYWEENPWVVALTFDVARGNIDRIAA